MELNKMYENIDANYSPIVGYLSICSLQEIKYLLETIKYKTGIMYDYFGFEYETDNTLTFYDFTSGNPKLINISVYDVISFLKPIIKEYLIQNPKDELIIESIINTVLL